MQDSEDQKCSSEGSLFTEEELDILVEYFKLLREIEKDIEQAADKGDAKE